MIMFCSRDEVSIFTNTSINETLDIIKERLNYDTEVKLQTNLNASDIMEELFVITTYFSYRGRYLA